MLEVLVFIKQTDVA